MRTILPPASQLPLPLAGVVPISSGLSGAADNTEIELKLCTTPQALEHLRRSPLVRELSDVRPVTRRLHSTYFDTAALALRESGVALRIREVGGQLIQCVKLRGNGALGLFVRPEFESPVASQLPRLDAVDDPELQSRLTSLINGEPLAPVVETDFRRTSRTVSYGTSEIRLEIDAGEVRTEKGRAPIAEVELELISGQAGDLYDLALAISEDTPLRPAQTGKVDLGFALLGVAPHQHRDDDRSTKLGRDATVSELLAAAIRTSCASFDRYETVMREGKDIEGVHQMRVAARSLRGVLKVHAKLLPQESAKRLADELSWLGRELGAARNSDVFLTETLGPLLVSDKRAPGLTGLYEAAQQLRAEAYRDLVALLDGPRYCRLLLLLGRWTASQSWLAQPLSPRVARFYEPADRQEARLLERKHAKAIDTVSDARKLSTESLHKLRIRLKTLRYGCEAAAPAFQRKGVRSYIARLKGLQDVLGHLNDAAISRVLLTALLQRLGPEAGPDHFRAAGDIVSHVTYQADRELKKLSKRWRKFKGVVPFWR